MTLDAILNQIKLEYPAATRWSDDQIVAFLNEEQNRIFDKLSVEAHYDFISIAYVRRYTLPADMQIDKIKSVLVSNKVSTEKQTGTVTVATGASTVTGSGTSFTSALEGQNIVINNELKTVAEVTSDTELSVTENFAHEATDADWYLYSTPEEEGLFTEYHFIEYRDVLKQTVPQGWYKYSENGADYIGFHPMPARTGQTIRVTYIPTPTQLVNNEAGLVLEPDLNYRWHYLLVYAAISEIAGSGSNPDTVIANNYALKYNTIVRGALESMNPHNTPGYGVTRDRMRPWNYSRRVLGRNARNTYYHLSGGDI